MTLVSLIYLPLFQAPPKLIKPELFNKQLPTNCGPVLIAQSSLGIRTQFFNKKLYLVMIVKGLV